MALAQVPLGSFDTGQVHEGSVYYMAGQQSHLPDLMRAASAILGLGATTTSAWLETTWETFPTTWETFSTTLELVTEPAGLAMESEWMKLELFKNGGQAGHNEIVYIHNNHTCCTIMYIYSVYIRSTGILYIYIIGIYCT